MNLKPVRLGKKTDLLAGKPRLIKVTINSVSTGKMLLSKAKHLRSSDDEALSFIYITPDMTPKERENSMKLREELKKRRLEGEHVIIRGGKIIPDNSSKRSSFRGTKPSGTAQGAEAE